MSVRFKVVLAVIVTALVASIASLARGGPAPDPAPTMPPDWIAIPQPDDAEKHCGNWAMREWHVTTSGNSVAISNNRVAAHDPLPSTISLRPNQVSQIGDRGARHVLQVEDGWLVGFDDGEWDGSLWWFSSDGKTSKELEGWSESAWRSAFAKAAHSGDYRDFPSPGNVHALIKTPHGILAFVGLAHMTLDEGAVFSVSRGSDGAWKAVKIATIEGEPEAVAADSSGGVLVESNKGVSRVSDSGEVTELHAIDTIGLYANSIAETERGEIFLGMRQYVVQLEPVGSSYTEQWYAPRDCPTFVHTDELSCSCVGASGTPSYVAHRTSHDNGPESIRRGPDGAMWFVESIANRIGRISSTGQVSEFDVAHIASSGMAVGEDGDVWFSSGPHSIVRRATSGKTTEYTVPSFSGYSPLIENIEPSRDGGIWFSDLDTAKIVHLTPDGRFEAHQVPAKGFVQIEIAVDRDDNVWFTGMNDDTVSLMTHAGAITQYHTPTMNSGPIEPRVAPDGSVWFYEDKTDTLAKLEPSTGVIHEIPLSSKPAPVSSSDGEEMVSAGPRGLAIADDGSIWFTDPDGNRVGHLIGSGPIKYFKLPTGSLPMSLAVDSENGAWFTEDRRGRIGRITAAGVLTEYELAPFIVTTNE